jgi:DNA polymerase III epsilon subunit-like protein
VIDVETTGPNPFFHDLLSLAIVPIDEPDEPFVAYLKTLSPKWAPYAAANFKSFEAEWKKQAKEPRKVVAALESYLRKRSGADKAMLIGHNVGFDFSFLRKLASYCGQEEIAGLSYRTIDTHTLLFVAWREGKLPESALGSDAAFKHFGIEFAPGGRHTALQDALATRTLFQQLLLLLARDTHTAAQHFSAR